MTTNENHDNHDMEYAYVGFWLRWWAIIIDGFLIGIIFNPILLAIYGEQYFESEELVAGPMDFLISWVFHAIVVIAFWVYRAATPGKMIISSKIVDAETGEHPSTDQFVIRYLSYYISAIPLCLGFIWAAFDERKQGWHDMLAGTVVVREKDPRWVKTKIGIGVLILLLWLL